MKPLLHRIFWRTLKHKLLCGLQSEKSFSLRKIPDIQLPQEHIALSLGSVGIATINSCSAQHVTNNPFTSFLVKHLQEIFKDNRSEGQKVS